MTSLAFDMDCGAYARKYGARIWGKMAYGVKDRIGCESDISSASDNNDNTSDGTCGVYDGTND